MLGRTKPNLFDLAVAVLAGFAGAYALADEKLSATLPGVAMAVALVPPLANSGLSLSLGSYVGAWGSFLLFFANFLSILLVSALVFGLAGLVPDSAGLSRRDLTRRFGLATVGFVIVTVLLGNALLQMARDRQTRNTIDAVLRAELQERQAMQLERLAYEFRGDTVFVLAHIFSPRVMSPLRVAELEAALSAGLIGLPSFSSGAPCRATCRPAGTRTRWRPRISTASSTPPVRTNVSMSPAG